MIRFLPFLLAVLVASPTRAPAQDRLLPPTFQPGMEYTIESRQHLETTLGEGMPNAGKQVVDISFQLVSTCLPHPEKPDWREVTVELAEVKMDVVMGGLKMTYDSSAPAAEETLLGQTFREIIGKSFQITLGPDDTVTAVEGIEQFDAENNPVSRQFGPEQLTQIAMPMVNLGIPRQGVVPGQTWKHDRDTAMGPAGNLQASYEVTYAGDQGNLARLEYEAELNLKLETAAGEDAPKSVIRVEDGALKGSMMVDRELRFPKSGEGTGSLRFIMPNPVDAEKSLELPVTQRRSFELLHARPVE